MDDDADEIWQMFKKQFRNIISDNSYYEILFQFLLAYEHNVLLYGAPGFPTDLFIDEVLKNKFNQSILHKTICHWNKDMVYLHNPQFIEINLMHHSISKNTKDISKFLSEIIKTKNITSQKHLIIIKHINILTKEDFISYRIILERFSNNAYFICTTHNIDKIDIPIKSRFSLFRIPLFTQQEISNIFSKYLKRDLNKSLQAPYHRNIIKALWISAVEAKEPELITKEFCTLNFPPITDMMQKRVKLEDIRQFSYKCFQYNISISELALDILRILPKNSPKRLQILKIAADIDHKLQMTNKGREPIYIEAFLCRFLI